MPTVYIVNKSGHDFSPATEFGKLVYLTEGYVSRHEVNNMHREIYPKLSDSSPEDYLLICGLNVLNVVACSIFARKHGRLNLLLYKEKKYKEYNLIIDDIAREEKIADGREEKEITRGNHSRGVE